MRLVIDLQFCQNADPALAEPALALARHLVTQAGGHSVSVAFSARHPARLGTLRDAFSNLLEPTHLLVYETPAPDGTARVQRTIELIRDNFFAAHGADVVFAPQWFDQPADAIGTIGTATGPFLTAVGVVNMEGLAGMHGAAPALVDALARRDASLAAASLLLAGSPEVAEALYARGCAPERVLAVDSDSDGVLAAQQAWRSFEEAHARCAAPAALAARATLAFISPLPPQQSGIADYSAELLVELEQVYDIHLIVPQVLAFDDAAVGRFPIHTVAWFEQHAASFERVLYHFGNSDVHQFMFGLLERHPGIVVLHDFFLGNVLDNMDKVHGQDIARRALFHSHGYTALAYRLAQGRNEAVWEFPSNKRVLECATGVIVHSPYSIELAEKWYGPEAAERWRLIPLLRGEPAGGTRERAQVRSDLGIGPDELVICSFGMMGQTKLNDRLFDAFLAQAPVMTKRCRLVFVGGADATEYGTALEQRIAASSLAGAVTITGFVDAALYRAWLQSADIAVQLRGQNRGETSASVLDCLLYGAATIVNAHGSNLYLPEDAVLKLPDQFSSKELARALGRLLDNAEARLALGERGRTLVRSAHAPAHVGAEYVAAIEAFSLHSPLARYRALLRSIAALGAPTDPRHHELLAAARAIAANQPVQPPRRLLIDVSAMVHSDLKTGIQRVVRSIVLSLIQSPPPGLRIEPVYSEGGNQRYRHARRFTCTLIGDAGLGMDDDPIEHRNGDIFLGLDLAAGVTQHNQRLLTEMHERGVRIYFVVYDLLPLLLPHAFPDGTEALFREYTLTIARHADGLLCISRAVSDELATWLKEHAPPRRAPLQIGYFHLGADIAASIPSNGLPDNAAAVFAAAARHPTFLMVGTVEPRKGHAQVLAAFELLWAQKVPVNLVVVGKAGWMMEPLIKKMRNHKHKDSHLFWLPGASDEMLTRLYESCAALVAASIGEGFGLPLIEAAQHHLPIIARNLPVFREVSGEHAFYFDGSAPADLAEALRAWLVLHGAGTAPQSRAMPSLNWEQSSSQLVDVVVDGNWYKSITL
jgi:glycosyltransferase involved in cell wall biosynthesis